MSPRSLPTALGALLLILATAPAARADGLSVEITIDSNAQVSSDHTYVEFTGSCRCGPVPQPQPTQGCVPATGYSVLRQAQGREIISGDGEFRPLCDGAWHPFVTRILGSSRFHGGPAHAYITINLQDCSTYQYVSGQADASVKIQGGGN
jgi:hypothetical protein